MTPTLWLAAALVAAAGAGLSTQGPINAALARGVGGPLTAAAISFGVGFALLATAALVRGGAPSVAPGLPWWAWCGGALGAAYVLTVVSTVGALGVLTVAAATVLGQLVAALVLDATGAFGLPAQPVTWARALAPVLVAGGLVLSRL